MFENIFTQYSANFAGLAVYAKAGTLIGLEAPDLTADGSLRVVEASLPTNEKIIFTGRFFPTAKGDICYQINYAGNSWGYVFGEDLNQFSKEPISSEGSKTISLIEQLIANNQVILENNLLCARIFEYTKQRGVVLPVDARQTLYNLQTRLMQRDETIEKSGYVQSFEKGTSPGLSVYNDTLLSFIANPGVGFVVTGTVAIIVSIVLVAGTFAAAYALFKSMHAQSVVDFGYSADLTAKLIKLLPPDVYQQLMSENEGNAKVANKAIANSGGSSMINTLKYLAVGFAGFYLVDKFLANRSKK